MASLRLMIDLHIHTNHSDSRSTVREVMEVAKARKLHGIAITDHNTLKGYEAAKKLRSGLIVIPGVEVKAKEGHIIGLGVLRPIQPKLNAVDVVERIHSQGGIAIATHLGLPIINHMEASRVKEARIDAIETFNSMLPLFNHYVCKAKSIAHRLGLPETGGSDAHEASLVGNAYTIIESNSPSLDDILEAIRRGFTQPTGSPSPLIMRTLGAAAYILSSMWLKEPLKA